jgi:hypothetical protein
MAMELDIGGTSDTGEKQGDLAVYIFGGGRNL